MSNLVEGLLKADKQKATEYATGVYKSKRLAKILGQNDSVDVQIREVDLNTIKNIREFSTRRDGSADPNKSFDANFMLVVEGVVDPDLRNKELQDYFGAHNARELAEILFRFEGNYIADAIIKLSDASMENAQDIIKN